ncbi:MAG: hypothetical protein IJI13_00820 [Oscillospiraceae bacterium]|nr:hypothetical protein [Oscillospiraceae bacterium]MBQ6316050.1 hypothetical protein [Oscillospiraceae bacterium]
MTDNLDRRILPFLWVHGESEEVYREMVKAIYDANIRAFCVEARPHEGFCQESWWRDMAILLDEAEKRGMLVWILDDKHFPTGFAAGEAQKAPIELRRQGLLHKRFPVKGGKIRLNAAKQAHPPVLKNKMYLLTDQINKNTTPQNQFHDDALLSVAAIRLDRQAEPIDLTDKLQNSVLDWTAPEGKWEVQLCYLSRNIGTHRSYINMMDRASCRIQIDAVYEPHYRHFGDKFGTVIAGFFSDEPELGNNSMYKMENPLGTEQDLPWSRELAAALEEKLGKGYAALLPLLWSNDCDPFLTAKVRYAFMDSVSRLVEEDFSHQIGQWCREHGVEYIGHVVEDNNQHARTGTSLGHYFRGLKWQSMAGIDDIGGQVEPGMEDRKKKNVFGATEDGEFYHYALGKLGSSLGALNPNMQGRTMCEIFGNYGWKEGVRLEKYLLDHFMVRGVNHFVPHAFTAKKYPDPDCPPHFYAHGHNPLYRHFGELMKYAERVTGMISGGRAVCQAAILYHGEAEWCGKAMLMQKPGRVLHDNQIDFHYVPADVFAERDFYKTEITDKLTVNGHEHAVLVIPYAQFITRETAEAVIELAARGGRVLFLEAYPDGLCTGDALPEDVKEHTKVVQLADLLGELSAYRTLTLSPANDRIRAMHYVGEKDFFYLVNEGGKPWRGTVTLPERGEYHIYDAWHDRSLAWDGGTLTIEPYHSLFLVKGAAESVYTPSVFTERRVLEGLRQSVCKALDYPKFGPATEIAKPEDYALTDKRFSGFIRYETRFTGKAQMLEITDAYEGVEVFLNGQSAGIQVVPPFRYDLRGLTQEGENSLVIEVATTLERERGKAKDAAPTGITGEVALYI